MFDPSVLDKYRAMSNDEKIRTLKVLVHLDEKPLSTLLAMLAVLEPDRVERIFEELGRQV